jgi:hypothetical protein
MDVLKGQDGPGKNAMIRQRMAAVWENWADSQDWVRETKDGLIGRQPE